MPTELIQRHLNGSVRRRPGAEYQCVGPELKRDKDECEDGEGNLKALGALLFLSESAFAPLRGRPGAEVADPREDSEIDERTECGEDEHGNADRVAVPAALRLVDAASSGERSEADGDADSAEGEHCRADALQQGHDKAGAPDVAGSGFVSD